MQEPQGGAFDKTVKVTRIDGTAFADGMKVMTQNTIPAGQSLSLTVAGTQSGLLSGQTLSGVLVIGPSTIPGTPGWPVTVNNDALIVMSGDLNVNFSMTFAMPQLTNAQIDQYAPDGLVPCYVNVSYGNDAARSGNCNFLLQFPKSVMPSPDPGSG
jgi:hypothetical protein